MSYQLQLMPPVGGFYAAKANPVQPRLTLGLLGLLGQMSACLLVSGIDPAIVTATLVAFASLLTQGVADVKWPNGLRAPLTTPIYLVSPSSSGKSVIFNILVKAVREFIAAVEADTKQASYPDFLIEDVSREAVLLHLVGWPYAGIFTDEGGQLDLLMRNGSPVLAKLTDGSQVGHARISTERITLVGRRLMMFVAEQPAVFERKKIALGVGKGGVGLLNRFHALQGQGATTGHDLHSLRLSPEVERSYALRVQELLSLAIKNAQDPKKPLPAIPLSSLAEEYLKDVSAHPWPRLVDPKVQAHGAEYVARRVERMLKLSAVLHVFEHGPEGEVGLDSMQEASRIGLASIDTFLDLTYVPPKPTQVELDAFTVEQSLRNTAQATGVTAWRLDLCVRSVANAGLTRQRFHRALTLLAGQGVLAIHLQGRHDWVVLQSVYDRLFRE